MKNNIGSHEKSFQDGKKKDDISESVERIIKKAVGRVCGGCSHLQRNYCFRPGDDPDDWRFVYDSNAPACGFWIKIGSR